MLSIISLRVYAPSLTVKRMLFPAPLYRTAIIALLSYTLAGRAFPQDQTQKKDTKRVWTNDDLSLFTRQPTANTPASSISDALPPTAPAEKRYLRATDAKWYVSKIKPLQERIDVIDSQLRDLRQARKDGKGTTGAIALDQDTEGVTTDAQIQIFEQRRKQLLLQIDALEDQSRRNGLDPGDIRSESPEEPPVRASVDRPGSAEENSQIAETERSIEQEIENLQRAKNEKDILQRNLDLRRRQVTSNPEYLTRHVGSSKLISDENELRNKEEQIQTAERRLQELQEHLEDQKLNPRTKLASDFSAVGHGPTSSNTKEENTESYWRKAFSELHYKIRMAQTELDLLQRELNVSLIQYDPNPAKAMRESITRRQINEHRKKIEDKKIEIRQLLQQESDLEDELRHSRGDPGWSRE